MNNEARDSFLEGLSRISFALGLGHFVCAPILYWRFAGGEGQFHYLATLFISGILLLGIGLLARYSHIRRALPYFCLAVLFLQAIYFLTWETTLAQPVTMFFPLLCALAAPLLGRATSSYQLAAASSITLIAFHFFVYEKGAGGLAGLILLHVVVLFSAFLSEMLWARIRRRETELETALTALRARTVEMETWVERLGQATNLISTGHVATALPGPPPSRVFAELTKSMEQMQERLKEYFTNLFLQDRLNSLGVLASGVAHELNTPLTTLHFLVAGSDKIPDETKKALILEIERLSKIAKSLLSFARPGDETVCDLNDIIRTGEPLLRRSVGDLVRLDLRLSAEPLPIRALANEIQQIVMNLFLNAADALDAQSAPVISIATQQVDKKTVVMSITDNGSGIPQEHLVKVLDPFFTTKPPGRGTGLGLFIVHRIAQRHGAQLSIQSRMQQGTTVELRFPLVEKDTSKPQPERKAA